jgi:hypothetical protein
MDNSSTIRNGASYLNVFDGRTQRRTYRFFSVALAVLRRAFFAACGFRAPSISLGMLRRMSIGVEL